MQGCPKPTGSRRSEIALLQPTVGLFPDGLGPPSDFVVSGHIHIFLVGLGRTWSDAGHTQAHQTCTAPASALPATLLAPKRSRGGTSLSTLLSALSPLPALASRNFFHCKLVYFGLFRSILLISPFFRALYDLSWHPAVRDPSCFAAPCLRASVVKIPVFFAPRRWPSRDSAVFA